VTLGGISISSLYKLVNDGVIPAIRLGSRTLFAVADICAVVDKQRQNPVPPRTMPWDRGGQMARKRWPRRDAVDVIEERGAAPVSPVSKKASAPKRASQKFSAGR
jgi:hypothetical protein